MRARILIAEVCTFFDELRLPPQWTGNYRHDIQHDLLDSSRCSRNQELLEQMTVLVMSHTGSVAQV